MQITPTQSRTLILACLITLASGLGYLFLSGTASGWFNTLVLSVYEQQRGFSRALSDAVAGLRHSSEGATYTLVSLSFIYGIFHAIGPGHGKAVISTYALTHETHFRRTVALSFASALVQGLSALAVVGFLSLLVEGGIRRFATSADDALNPISFAAVTAVGLYLLVRGANALRHRTPQSNNPVHAEGCGCGHSHAPTPQHVEDASSLRRAAAIALAVGIRPCSGAILVLVLSFAFGFIFSGIAAVLAMSLGTAITVCALAVGAQGLRWPLAHVFGTWGVRAFGTWGVRADALSASLMIAGGAFIMIVGVTLLYGALTTPSHPFF